MKTVRHNPDPNYRAMAGTDDATLIARGRADGELYECKARRGEIVPLPSRSRHDRDEDTVTA